MFKAGGIKPFFVGTTATISRDAMFGAIFAGLRHMYLADRSVEATSQSQAFVINMMSALVATALSSPLNYVRNIHYSTPISSQKYDSFGFILRNLHTQIKNEPTLLRRIILLQERLQIGWGTARVSCGMAFGAHVYNYFCKLALDAKL
jgi:hypothetical protein